MKETLGDLALFGGPVEFAEPLVVGRPNIGDRQRLATRIADALDRRRLTNNGPLVRELETRIADYLGVGHCIAVCNATIGLEIVARALDLSGEVVMPSFTFVATAHAMDWVGLTPVFCDIDPATHCLDPASVERAITPRTSAILGVHVWGRACDVDALSTIAARHRLPLIFDAAHAFGCSHRQRMIGNFGVAEVFSFHATKFLNSFEGGAITTSDEKVALRLCRMRNFGLELGDDVGDRGTNAKMTEVSAAMGLTSLEDVDFFIYVNRRHYDRYREQLDGVPGVEVARYDKKERRNYQYVVVTIDPDTAGLTRDALMDVLAAENVVARRYFSPAMHETRYYRAQMARGGAPLAHSERLSGSVMCLPTGTALSQPHVDAVCAVIRVAVAHAGDVTARLREGSSSESLHGV